MDEKLIALTTENKFEKVSNTMRADIDMSNLQGLMNRLHGEHGVNVSLKLHEFESIKDEIQKQISRIRPIEHPPKEEKAD